MSLDSRFEGVKRAAPPDLWSRIDYRVGIPSTPDIPARNGSRRVGRSVGGAIAALAVAAVFVWAVVGLAGLGTSTGNAPVPGGGFRPGQIARYPVANAQPLVFGGGAAWVSGSVQGWPQIWRVDAASGESKPLPNTRGGLWPAFGEGYAWVTCSGHQDNPCGGEAVLKLDPTTGATVARIALPSRPHLITTGMRSVWVSSEAGVLQIDPSQDKVIQTMVGVLAPGLIGVAGGRVWVTSLASNQVVGFDPSTGKIVAKVRYADPCLFAAGDAGVFVASCGGVGSDGMLRRIDPRSGHVTFSTPLLNRRAANMILFGGRLWIGNWQGNGPEIIPLDPSTGQPSGDPVAFGPSSDPWQDSSFIRDPLLIAGGANSLWVTHLDANDVVRVGVDSAG